LSAVRGAAEGFGQRLGRAGGSGNELQLGSDAGMLGGGDVKSLADRGVERGLLGVGHHADDRHPGRLGGIPADADAVADGILVRPRGARHGFIDDDDLRRTCLVAVVEFAPRRNGMPRVLK